MNPEEFLQEYRSRDYLVKVCSPTKEWAMDWEYVSISSHQRWVSFEEQSFFLLGNTPNPSGSTSLYKGWDYKGYGLFVSSCKSNHLIVWEMLEPEVMRQGYLNKNLLEMLSDMGIPVECLSKSGKLFVRLYGMNLEAQVYHAALEEMYLP